MGKTKFHIFSQISTLFFILVLYVCIQAPRPLDHVVHVMRIRSKTVIYERSSNCGYACMHVTCLYITTTDPTFKKRCRFYNVTISMKRKPQNR